MDYSAYEDVSVARSGRVLTLSLNRPDTLNAVTARMHRELSCIFGDVAREDIDKLSAMLQAAAHSS